MKLSEEQAKTILQTHDALWNAVLDFDGLHHVLTHDGQKYDIFIPAQRGYASVILPNSNGIPFLWITQNLNKSTYGSLQIKQARDKDLDLRITWVVDTRNGQFNYRSTIKTCRDADHQLMHGSITHFDSYGEETLWSTNKSLITRQAKF